ncbi:hypothetical protein C4556_02665 [Candidatus Parcubacteria bacterium]|nr:MAG: hypothetical protein C4556_02665 [Candidatus Parcubacteria bacterium]
MTKTIALGTFLTGIVLLAGVAFAQEPNITFPIAELGGCNSKEECKTYCDTPGNALSCVSFAEARGLMTTEEAATARKFAGQTGPGGCMGSECRRYCSQSEHREECYAFAKENGLTPPGPRIDVEEPKIDEDRAMRIVEEQGGPGGCRTFEECHSFCEDEGNMERCLAFAAEHDLMSPADLERARKMMAEGGPGGCKGIACRSYCENPDHADECLRFAEEQGFIEPEEAEKARRLMNAVGPGGCRGRECQTYCEDPAHRSACFEFAVENGLIPEEEAARMRQFMESGMGGGPEGFSGPPGEFREFSGPGGCTGPEECRRYCTEHPDECQGFGPPEGDGRDFGQERAIEMREFEIPPGLPCTTPEECHRLFQENPEQFGSMMQGPQGELPEGMQSGSFEDRQQMELQYREQYQGAEGEFQQFQPPPPPDGTFVPPPDGTYYPPPSDGYPTGGESYPTEESYQPPPEAPMSEPVSGIPATNLLAAVFSIVAVLFGF